MNIQPKNGWLLTEAVPQKEITDSGIIIPDGIEEDAEFQTSYCKVLAVSEGSEYKVGQTVLFSKLVPDDVFVEENGEKKTLWFVRESDIKAIYGKTKTKT